METENLPDHFVFSPAVIDFVTVVAETCIWLERIQESDETEFVDTSVKILPLLYLKASMLEIPERSYEDMTERFVTEDDYLQVKNQIEILLGEHDSYLETFHPDMALSDTPIAAFVSEDLADCYQELKDFAANYQQAETDVMNDALVTCLEAFREHWGRKLLNALRALHHIRYSEDFGQEDEPKTKEKQKVNRNGFLDFLRDEEDDEIF